MNFYSTERSLECKWVIGVCDSLGFLTRCSSKRFNLGWFLRSSFRQCSEVHRETWVLESYVKLRIPITVICGNGRLSFRHSVVLGAFINLVIQVVRAAVQCMIYSLLLQNFCSSAVVEIALCDSEDFHFNVTACLCQVWILFANIKRSCNLDSQAY